MALGQNAQATNTNALAIGQSAIAAYDNSTAFGAGATLERDPIGESDRRDNRVEIVIAVGTWSEHGKGQVDLARGVDLDPFDATGVDARTTWRSR